MTLDDRRVQRVTDDSAKRVDRMLTDVRAMSNEFYNLGNDFRNDRRFSPDAYRLRDDLGQLERQIQRTRDRVRSIERNRDAR